MAASAGDDKVSDDGEDGASQLFEQGDRDSGLIAQLFSSPINVALLVFCIFLLYKIVKSRRQLDAAEGGPGLAALVPMKKRDFTVEQLKEFDGRGSDGRILMAVNGKVFDVTKEMKTYGPGGPYGIFAGRDASRGLGTFSLKDDVIKDHYDDLSDLTSKEMDKIREWEEQFQENYTFVGRLLKEGEEPTDYSDMEEELCMQDKSKND